MSLDAEPWVSAPGRGPSLRRTGAPRRFPWVALVAALAVAITGLVVAAWVARDPKRRKVVFQGASRTWVRMEDAASRGGQRLSRRRHRFEEEARRIARELWDAVDDLPLFPECFKIPPVPRRPYAHGAYMGAAPALMRDDRWRRILAFLMPDVFRDVRAVVVRGGSAGELIPMFENNPVMAAFGVWRTVEIARATGTAPSWGPAALDAMEWDVFLSSAKVDAWGDLADAEAREAALRDIVDTMVVAHASTTDTLQEQLGLCQWADVRKTSKAALGGVEPGAWLDLFARALTLAEAADLRQAIGTMMDEPRIESHEACLMHTFARPMPAIEAVDVFRRFTGRPRFSVVLEVKSLAVTRALLGALVAELNRRHVHVAAVGSFVIGELRGLSEVEQIVGDEVLNGPLEILFLHFAEDLLRACERGALHRGAAAMFNGASLLLAEPHAGPGAARFSYTVDAARLEAVGRWRAELDLSLGLYVQENDCDADAATLLSELVDRHADTFALGFAWGGVLDEVAIEGGRGDHRGFGSQRVIERFRTATARLPAVPRRA